MASKRVSIELTAEQRAQLKDAVGADADQLELTVDELEERIAPSRLRFVGGGHAGWIEL